MRSFATKMDSKEEKRILISLEASIDRFQTHCEQIEYTDTGLFHDLLAEIRGTLKALIKNKGDTPKSAALP